MKQQLLRAASVCALVVAMGGAAIAQGSGGSGSTGGGGTGGTQDPSSKQQPTAPGGSGPGGRDAGETRQTPRGSAGETMREKGGSAAERPSQGQPKASERQPDGSAPKSRRSEDKDGAKDRPRSSEQRKGEKDRQRATEREQDKDRRTGQGAQDKDRRTGQGEQDRNRKTGEREQDRDRRTGQRGGGDGKDRARTQLSEQQRTNVRERLSRSGSRDRLNSVNFDVRVGSRVPRNVTLHVLPPDVVEIAPAYSSYRYVYVGDDYVIIDPVSYEVVAVLGSGSRTAGARRGLSIAPPDRVFVREHIDRGSALRLGIGGISIGMDVPNTVELRPLPSVVVDRVPDLRGHRYFVYENEIAIVDPQSDEIVMIIDE